MCVVCVNVWIKCDLHWCVIIGYSLPIAYRPEIVITYQITWLNQKIYNLPQRRLLINWDTLWHSSIISSITCDSFDALVHACWWRIEILEPLTMAQSLQIKSISTFPFPFSIESVHIFWQFLSQHQLQRRRQIFVSTMSTTICPSAKQCSYIYFIWWSEMGEQTFFFLFFFVKCELPWNDKPTELLEYDEPIVIWCKCVCVCFEWMENGNFLLEIELNEAESIVARCTLITLNI